MTGEERDGRDRHQDRKRSRLTDVAAAATGIAAGGVAQHEEIAGFIAGDADEGGESSPPTGLPDGSLDVFDDMEPDDASRPAGEGGAGMPSLRFDAPGALPDPEREVPAGEPDVEPAPPGLPDTEVPAGIFNPPAIDIFESEHASDLDEDQPDDLDVDILI